MPSRPPAPRWTAASIASLPAETRKAILTGLSGEEAVRLLHDWRFWARAAQLPPAGRWRIWLILAGRGFGKTRAGAEWVRARIETGRAKRIALVGETLADARQVMVEGESGLLAISPPWNRPLWQPSLRRLTWPNGAVATAFSADDPEQLRGPQFDAAWADQLAGSVPAERRAFLSEEYRTVAAADPAVLVAHPLSEERRRMTLLEDPADAAAEADRLLALHGVRRDLIEFELPVATYFAAGAPWLGDEIAYRDAHFLDYAEGRPLILLGVEEDYTADRIILQAWG